MALGPFFDVAVMTNNESLQSRFNGASGRTETELLTLLDYYYDPTRPADHGDCEPTVIRFVPEIENRKLAYIMHKPVFRGINAAEMTGDASSDVNKAVVINSRVVLSASLRQSPQQPKLPTL
ncbi:108b54a2-8253-4804-a865-ec1c8740c64d [Sclerotinia trifoliorum]|uniref:108b54a2-8253-4804-a865-ec1c8740c64d n=1 Tax=Sclerotinia trifoliorum TaxID=28548 RepID=A0A8H2W552_9HELO|nr:108b54a2-8253-4804-a865-ec1c8740c64d [Sclerotinia trifoliorum]